MDRKRQKLSPGKNEVQKECQDAKITALERKFEHMENKLKLNDVQRECQDEKITSLERKLEHMENKLKLVIAELEQVKEEQARSELESEIDKYKEQCNELQSENEKLQNKNEKLQSENEKLQSENVKLQSENKRLQKYLQDLESANINVEENSQINPYNTDLNSQITKVNESSDDVLDINSLPNEIILHIFCYLEQNQLGQIARVCRRWNVLTRSPVLWKKVNVKFSPLHGGQTVANSFINRLSTRVTSIRLDFTESGNWIEPLHFEKLCLRLQKKCPHLKELILIHCVLSNSLSSVIGICTRLLQNVKNFVFHYSVFRCYRSTDGCFHISKMQNFEFLYCYFDCSNKPPFSKMLNLTQLHLYGKNVDACFMYDKSFLNHVHVLNLGFTKINSLIYSIIQSHGHNLRELYLCCALLEDRDLAFIDSAFPHLKTICLRGPNLTCGGVVYLIHQCPSLENVYVRERVAESFAAHPFVLANRYKSGIVKAIACNHNHNVKYSHT